MDNTRLYGYARVSTKEQVLTRQIDALKEYGVPEAQILADKESGKDFNRVQYQNLKNVILRAGDTLVIKELDRLGRDWDGIKKEWQELADKGINIVVIDQPMLNTVGKSDLEKKLIQGILFDLLAYMAEKERVKIRSRQREGIDAMPINEEGHKISTKTGNKYGRPAVTYPNKWLDVYGQWKEGGITAVKAMDQLGLKKTSFYKLVKEYEGSKEA